MNTIPRTRNLPVATTRRDGHPDRPCPARRSAGAGDASCRQLVASPPLARLVAVIVACSIVGLSTGCTSALTSAYLRAMPWETADHAAEPEPDTASPSDAPADASDVPSSNSATLADDEGDERRAAAIDEAVSRLTRLGTLDEAAAASLVATLRGTQQEDWPVVIAEFAAALEPRTVPPAAQDPAGGADSAVPTAPTAPPHVVAKADLTPASVVSATVAATPPGPPRTADDQPASPAAPVVAPAPAPPEIDAAPPSPTESTAEAEAEADASAAPASSFRVTNPCFASRVQAWGVVDRFPVDRFRAGREVIVYFELDKLSAQATTAGHTTCIDTILRLVDERGATVHEWNFEPLAETCAGRRRDYFARYVVRLPADVPPGPCRLQVVVTDTLAGADADATLPLEIIAASEPDAG
jgi:hypothetical protein